MLEAGIVRAACERATDEELAALRAFVERSRDVPEDSDATRLLELDEAFHLTLARYSRNDEFVRALESVNARIHFVRWIDMQQGAAAIPRPNTCASSRRWSGATSTPCRT